MHLIKVFFSTLLASLLLDALWLGVLAKSIYQKEIGALMGATSWFAVVLVYFLLTLGIVFFVVPRCAGDGRQALLWGAFFGLISYGIYDMTNLAILKGWTVRISVIDMLWGAVICALSSLVAAYMDKVLR